MVAASGSRNRLREAAVVGIGNSAATVINLVRTKAIAILVGVEGAGLIQQFSSILSTVAATVTLGMGQSGIQRIAMASKDEMDSERVSIVFRTLQMLSVAMGVAGTVGLIVLARPIAAWALGDATLYPAVILLAPGILITAYITPFNCLVEGLQKIALISRLVVVRALLGLVAAVSALGIAGNDGVLPYVLLSTFASLVVVRWMARDFLPKRARAAAPIILDESKQVLRLGGALAVSGLVLSWTQFAERGFLVGALGVEAIGLIACSTALCDLIANLIWSSTGTSFFPRVSQLQGNQGAVSRALSEQVELLCFLLLPISIVLILFGDILVVAAYSAEFEAAQGVLQFQALSLMGYCIHTPMRILLGGLGLGRALINLSLIAAALRLGGVVVLIPILGVEGYGVSAASSSLLIAATYLLYARATGTVKLRPSLIVFMFLSAVGLSLFVTAHAFGHLDLSGFSRILLASMTLGIAICIGWKRYQVQWSDVLVFVGRLGRRS